MIGRTVHIPQVGQAFGSYHIDRVLGRGGMGVVFVATQLTLNRSVALKVLLPQFANDEDYRRRFSREGSALANAQSPYIVPIFDYGEIDGSLFIATQLVPGSDLGTRIKAGPLGLAATLDITRHVATALADAHAVGVLHRDVKPSNVLIWDRGDGPHAYLCDFGIAKIEGVHQTTTEGTVGTWAFLAPERCNGAPATEASDIYAAGCLLWNMLTGSPPYSGTPVEIAMAHVSAPVPQLTGPNLIGPNLTGQPNVDADLNNILARALAKDPQARFASASEMAQELRALRARLPTVDPVIAPGTSYDATWGGPPGPKPPPLDVPVNDPTEHLSDPAVEPPQRDTPSRRWPAVLAAIVVLGLVGWQALAQGWLDGDSDSPNSDAADSPNSATPPSGEEGGGATCWDGTEVAELSQCSDPEGLAGLAWMVPSMDPDDPTCYEKDEIEPGKTLVWVCPFLFRGASGTIRYSEWQSAPIANAHYREEYGAQPRRVVSLNAVPRYLWRLDERTEEGLFRMTTSYVRWPFSISIAASTRAAREAAYRQLTFRPESQLTGVTTGD